MASYDSNNGSGRRPQPSWLNEPVPSGRRSSSRRGGTLADWEQQAKWERAQQRRSHSRSSYSGRGRIQVSFKDDIDSYAAESPRRSYEQSERESRAGRSRRGAEGGESPRPSSRRGRREEAAFEDDRSDRRRSRSGREPEGDRYDDRHGESSRGRSSSRRDGRDERSGRVARDARRSRSDGSGRSSRGARADRDGRGRDERQDRRSTRGASRQQEPRSSRRQSTRAAVDEQAETPDFSKILQQGSGDQTLFAPRTLLGGRLPLILAAIAIVVVAFLLVNLIGSCIAGGVHPAKWGIDASASRSYSLSPNDLSSLEGSTKLAGVELGSEGEGSALSLDEGNLGDVNDAIYKIEKTAHCGFVFLDIQTGRALTYNTGEVMYCASAVKAPLCYYATTHPTSGGGSSDYSEDEYDEDEYGSVDEEPEADSGSPASSLSDSDQTAIENAIVWSSNDDYFNLCSKYMNDDYLGWLKSYGVSYSSQKDGNFPSMNAGSLSALWAQIYEYLQGSSTEQKWLKGLFEKTETSYIRDGLKTAGATVRDKAGWISDGETDAVVDAGVVSKDGHDYLMVIITGQRDTAKGHRNVAELASALFEARGELASDITLTC